MKKILTIITILFNLVACSNYKNEDNITNLTISVGDKFEKVYEYSNCSNFIVYLIDKAAMFTIDNYNYVIQSKNKSINDKLEKVIDGIYVFPVVYPKYKNLKKLRCGMEVYELVEILGVPIIASTGLQSSSPFMAFEIYDEFDISITTRVYINVNKICEGREK